MEFESDAYITRHSTKGDGSPYGELSPEGVEKAKARVEEIAKLVESAPEGSVIFIGGNSDSERTRSTLEVYADGLKEQLGEKDGYIFSSFRAKGDRTEGDVPHGYLEAVRALQEKADADPKAKVVVDMQLQMKELGMDRLMDENGEVKEDWMELLDKHGKDYTAAVKEWIGDNPTDVDPREVAEDYLYALERLERFVKKFSGEERETKFILVGHSFLIDVLLTYLANDGQISPEGFDEIGGTVVEETELARIESKEDGTIHLYYRGEEYTFPQADENPGGHDRVEETE